MSKKRSRRTIQDEPLPDLTRNELDVAKTDRFFKYARIRHDIYGTSSNPLEWKLQNTVNRTNFGFNYDYDLIRSLATRPKIMNDMGDIRNMSEIGRFDAHHLADRFEQIYKHTGRDNFLAITEQDWERIDPFKRSKYVDRALNSEYILQHISNYLHQDVRSEHADIYNEYNGIEEEMPELISKEDAIASGKYKQPGHSTFTNSSSDPH